FYPGGELWGAGLRVLRGWDRIACMARRCLSRCYAVFNRQDHEARYRMERTAVDGGRFLFTLRAVRSDDRGGGSFEGRVLLLFRRPAFHRARPRVDRSGTDAAF